MSHPSFFYLASRFHESSMFVSKQSGCVFAVAHQHGFTGGGDIHGRLHFEMARVVSVIFISL